MRDIKDSNYFNSTLVPDAIWKQWTLDNLPESTLTYVTDVDSIVRSKSGCITLVEIKKRNAKNSTCQNITLGILATLLAAHEGDTIYNKDYLKFPIYIKRFKGIQYITFENLSFDDGKVYLNGSLSSEKEIRDILNFSDDCNICYPDECHQDYCNCLDTDID